MPISANKLVYDTGRKYNALNTGRAKDYKVVDVVSTINDAYELVIEHLIIEKDQNETLRNHLRPLIRNKNLTCSPTNDVNICTITYPSDFYEHRTLNITVEKGCCLDAKTFPVQKPQGDDLDEARRNPYRRSDYYFEQALCYETKNGLKFYHDKEFEIISVALDYYKKIKRIEAPELVKCGNATVSSYKNWDSEVIDKNVSFEIDSTFLNRKVTDVAVYLLSNSSEDFAKANEFVKQIFQINQLHK